MTSSQAKCEAIARTFYFKLQAPATLQPETDFPNADHCPLTPFNERIVAEHLEVTHVEVLKAVGGLAVGKALEPDLFPEKVYKKLSGLTPYLVEPINMIYATGRMPKML